MFHQHLSDTTAAAAKMVTGTSKRKQNKTSRLRGRPTLYVQLKTISCMIPSGASTCTRSLECQSLSVVCRRDSGDIHSTTLQRNATNVPPGQSDWSHSTGLLSGHMASLPVCRLSDWELHERVSSTHLVNATN